MLCECNCEWRREKQEKTWKGTIFLVKMLEHYSIFWYNNLVKSYFSPQFLAGMGVLFLIPPPAGWTLGSSVTSTLHPRGGLGMVHWRNVAVRPGARVLCLWELFMHVVFQSTFPLFQKQWTAGPDSTVLWVSIWFQQKIMRNDHLLFIYISSQLGCPV